MRGEIEPPSKLIVGFLFCPNIMFMGGGYYEEGRLNRESYFMRGEIEPPSKLMVGFYVCPIL